MKVQVLLFSIDGGISLVEIPAERVDSLSIKISRDASAERRFVRAVDSLNWVVFEELTVLI